MMWSYGHWIRTCMILTILLRQEQKAAARRYLTAAIVRGGVVSTLQLPRQATLQLLKASITTAPSSRRSSASGGKPLSTSLLLIGT